MKKVFLFTALAIAAMTSCSKEGGNNDAGAYSENPISMRAVVDKPGNSRAAEMSGTRFTNFHVLAAKNVTTTKDLTYLDAAVFSLDGGTTWNYSPRAYYPADESTLSFFAYAPIGDVNMTTPMTHSGTDNDVTFGYTVPADQTTKLAEDLLVSCVLDNAYVANADVTYTFDHALSSATFAAQNKNAVGSELVYVIHKIEITNLYNEGTFAYGSPVGTWVPSGASDVSYVAPIPVSGVSVEPVGPAANQEKALLTTNDFLIILPQQPTWGVITPSIAGSFVEVTFSVRDGNGVFLYNNETRQLEVKTGDLFDNGFEAGKRYDFTFSFDESSAVTMDVNTVTGWSTIGTGTGL